MTHDEKFAAFLDDISACFIRRDFALWQSKVLYPFSLITSAGPVVLSNDEQLLKNFNLYLIAIEAMHLDQIHRTPVSLENCQDGSWIGTYETNLLSHGVRATAPYTSSALLYEDEDTFRMMSILNARGHHEWTGEQPHTFH